MGLYTSLLRELEAGDAPGYRNFVRMNTVSFQLLLDKVKPAIQRKDTRMRLAILTKERLALILHFVFLLQVNCFIFLSVQRLGCP